MTKLNLLLVLALLASSLWQVKTAYEARQLFNALDQARAERQQLDAEYKRLDAEAQAQGTHLFVERKAREKLLMRPATPAVTKYVTDAVGLSASASASSSSATSPNSRAAVTATAPVTTAAATTTTTTTTTAAAGVSAGN
jgi:cell division protein FtsL